MRTVVELLIITAVSSWRFLIFATSFGLFGLAHRYFRGLPLEISYHIGFVAIPFVGAVTVAWMFALLHAAVTDKKTLTQALHSAGEDERRRAKKSLIKGGHFRVF